MVYPKKEVRAIKAAKWRCGDYTCDAGCIAYHAGDVTRIRFPPPAEKRPINTIISDGSKWTLSDGCREDG